jgi:hypothetical protein
MANSASSATGNLQLTERTAPDLNRIPPSPPFEFNALRVLSGNVGQHSPDFRSKNSKIVSLISVANGHGLHYALSAT